MSEETVRKIKFLFFSLSAGAIQLGSFTLLREVFHLSNEVSYRISLVLSVLWNFTLNRNFTFKSANNKIIAMFQVFCYYLVFTPISSKIEYYFADVLKYNAYFVTIFNMTLNMVTEFIFQRYYVFKDSINTKKS